MGNTLVGFLPGLPARLKAPRARRGGVAGLVLLWVVLALQAGLVVLRLRGPVDSHWPATGLPFLDAWGHLDSVWYVRIAGDGYAYSSNGASAWAFFPAFPAVMRVVTALTGVTTGIAGYVVALVGGLGALLVFREFAALWLPRKQSVLAAAALALYPYSFFLRGPLYTDGMALGFIVGSFLALERRRVPLSCLLALLASCTRFEVIPLAVALTWRAWELRPDGDRGRWAVVLLPGGSAVLGQCLVSAYSFFRVGDPLAFYHAQSYAGWQGGSLTARLLKRGYTQRLSALVSGQDTDAVRLVLETGGLFAVVGACFLVPVVAKRLSRAYAAFVVLSIVVVVTGTASFFSSGRYVLACFPCFVVLVVLVGRRPRKAYWVVPGIAAALLVQGVFAIGFSQGVLVG